MTISAVRHNEIVRMLAEGILSQNEIAMRVKCGKSTVTARIGKKLIAEPLYCHQHKTTTEVDVFRENINNGLPGCNMCAAEVGSTHRYLNGAHDERHCWHRLDQEETERMERVRNGEVDCRAKPKSKGEGK